MYSLYCENYIRCHFSATILLTMVIAVAPLDSFAQNAPAYFYHGYKFGSEATFNPLSTILNGGFGIMQLGNRDKKIFDVQYRAGWQNVWTNISNPGVNISKFGWKHFLTTEIFPTTLSPRGAQYFPNYQNHLIGGGMTYRAVREWFAYHGFRYTTLWSLATITAYHTLNEVVENNNYRGTNVDPIADIIVFNPLGIALFSFDRVARFFGETLQLRDWSFFPTIDPWTATIENNGQNFSIKWHLKKSGAWGLFYNFGVNGIMGLSYRRADGRSFSFGGGLMARSLRQVKRDDNIRSLTADLVWNIGAFYDRQGSLLASFLLSGSRAYKARATIYPGIIRFAGLSPGVFSALGQKNEIIAGVYLPLLPLGLSASR